MVAVKLESGVGLRLPRLLLQLEPAEVSTLGVAEGLEPLLFHLHQPPVGLLTVVVDAVLLGGLLFDLLIVVVGGVLLGDSTVVAAPAPLVLVRLAGRRRGAAGPPGAAAPPGVAAPAPLPSPPLPDHVGFGWRCSGC